MLEGLALGFPAAIMIERLFERGTGLGLGKANTEGWPLNIGIFHDPEYAPVYLYEALASFLLLILMLALSRRKRFREGREPLLPLFLLLWGLIQPLLESLRADDHMVYHFVKAQQVLAICFPVAVMIRWTARARRQAAKAWQLILPWCVTLAAIGGAVAAEFGVDRWGRPMAAYGLMIACLLLIGGSAFFLRGLGLKEEKADGA